MSLEDTYLFLQSYCRINQYMYLKETMDTATEKIDLIGYADGALFSSALRHKTPETLNTLIEYYEKTQLQGDPNSLEYKVARHELLKVLEEAVDSTCTISEEVQKVLDRYLPKEEGSDIDELEEIELTFDDNDSTSSHSKGEESEGSTLSHDSAASSNGKYAKLTEYSLKMLEAVQEDPSEGVHLGGENVELIDNQLQI